MIWWVACDGGTWSLALVEKGEEEEKEEEEEAEASSSAARLPSKRDLLTLEGVGPDGVDADLDSGRVLLVEGVAAAAAEEEATSSSAHLLVGVRGRRDADGAEEIPVGVDGRRSSHAAKEPFKILKLFTIQMCRPCFSTIRLGSRQPSPDLKIDK